MKILASDFDNTLFFLDFRNDGEGYIKKTDIEKIEDFQAKGNLFGLCTGRALFDVFFDAKDIISFDFYILASGAVILDKDYKTLHKAVIPFSTIKDMYLLFKNKYNYSPLFVTEKSFCCIQKKIYNVDTDIYQSIDEMDDLEFIAISYVLNTLEESYNLCTELNSKYGDIIVGYQNSTNVDIVLKGNSKGTGIELIKKYYNLDKIYGIGDSYNDLPMLQKVDVPFTFHCSPEPVKQQAAYLVDDIAQAIEIIEQEN